MGGLERTVGLVGPYRFLGKVVEGFKRGSKELGWPTANLDPASFEAQLDKEQEGVYLGWAAVEEDGVLLGGKVHKAVLSIGAPRLLCLLADASLNAALFVPRSCRLESLLQERAADRRVVPVPRLRTRLLRRGHAAAGVRVHTSPGRLLIHGRTHQGDSGGH